MHFILYTVPITQYIVLGEICFDFSMKALLAWIQPKYFNLNQWNLLCDACGFWAIIDQISTRMKWCYTHAMTSVSMYISCTLYRSTVMVYSNSTHSNLAYMPQCSITAAICQLLLNNCSKLACNSLDIRLHGPHTTNGRPNNTYIIILYISYFNWSVIYIARKTRWHWLESPLSGTREQSRHISRHAGRTFEPRP